MVAFSQWLCGQRESARKTVRGLQKLLESQSQRFDDIVGNPGLKEDISRRPHVRFRFNAEGLSEVPEGWANAQNDALGAVLWLRYLMANKGESVDEVSPDESALHERMLKYLRAIQFWEDLDSGAWEETRRVNCSSIGAVLAGLQQILSCSKANPAVAVLAGELYKPGRKVLEKTLPFESPPVRKADAAMLLLIFPFEIVNETRTQDQILSLVRARLVGPMGIRRYIGDSYYCQDYDKWFPPTERAVDFSKNIAFRDELLVPGQEAQWCLFDPLISAIYGRRDSSLENRRLQVMHFQRAMRQLTAELRCPELYYLRKGRFVPNEHTPLLWTQANLAIALLLMEQAMAA